jgi:hypothetical protein
MPPPVISTWTPVIVGRVSSLPAATAVCATAFANSSASMVPMASGICGRLG